MTLKSILANHLALGLIASGLSAQIGTIDDGESGASIRAKLNTAITEVNDLGAAGFLTGDDLELNNHTPAGDWTFAKPLTSAGLISTGPINGDGSGISGLNATNITTGTLSTARIPNSIARLADIDTFAKLDAIVSDESLAYFGALPDLDAYQLLVADIPALDWSAGVAYGPSGVLDPRLDWDSRILSGSWTIDYLSVTGLTIGSTVSLPPASVTRTEIADDAIGANQLDTLGAYTAASLSLTSVLQLSDIDIDPTDPAPGASVLWLSSGADSGDAGDLMVKINSGGTVTTFTLIDFAP